MIELESRITSWIANVISYQFSSVTHQTLSDPVHFSTPGCPVHHQLPEPTQTHVHRVDDGSNHRILCCPLLLPPSIFPSIRVFSNELVLRIRWPKYWSFSFGVNPSTRANQVYGNSHHLIYFRISHFLT